MLTIKIENHTEDWRKYFTTAIICQGVGQLFFAPLRSTSEKYLKELGEIGEPLVRDVFNIPGITQVIISPYQLTVQKGGAFDWKDIQPKVLDVLLKRTLGEGLKHYKIVYPERTPKSEKTPRKGFIQKIWETIRSLGKWIHIQWWIHFSKT